jgi:hypothetical protein
VSQKSYGKSPTEELHLTARAIPTVLWHTFNEGSYSLFGHVAALFGRLPAAVASCRNAWEVAARLLTELLLTVEGYTMDGLTSE